jgi:hypothetical protein
VPLEHCHHLKRGVVALRRRDFGTAAATTRLQGARSTPPDSTGTARPSFSFAGPVAPLPSGPHLGVMSHFCVVYRDLL